MLSDVDLRAKTQPVISATKPIIALIGFACVLFTYLGLNYLSGLHSYLRA